MGKKLSNKFKPAASLLPKIVIKFKAVIYKILSQFHPMVGLTLAGYIGWILYYLYLGAKKKDVQEFLGGIPDDHSRQLSKKISMNFIKNDLVKFLLKSDQIDELAGLFRFHNEENLLKLYRLKKPAIIVYSHLGPNLASMIGLYKLGIKFLIIQPKMYYNYPKRLDSFNISDRYGRDNTPYVLKNAYNYLKNNGFVLISIDGFMGKSAIRVNFMQRQYPFQSGIASLHRLTGAPIIPITVEWVDNNRINFSVHNQIAVPASCEMSQRNLDEQITTKVVEWLEQIIRANPEQIRLNQLPKYLSAFV